MYHEMKKEELLISFSLINEFSAKFPGLKVHDINYIELAKFYNQHPKNLLTAIVMLDCLKEINAKGTNSFFIDMEKVSKVKVKRERKKWVFFIHTNAKKKIRLQHFFELQHEVD